MIHELCSMKITKQLTKSKRLFKSLFFFWSVFSLTKSLHSSTREASLTHLSLSNQQLSSPPHNTFHTEFQKQICVNEPANCHPYITATPPHFRVEFTTATTIRNFSRSIHSQQLISNPIVYLFVLVY